MMQQIAIDEHRNEQRNYEQHIDSMEIDEIPQIHIIAHLEFALSEEKSSKKIPIGERRTAQMEFFIGEYLGMLPGMPAGAEHQFQFRIHEASM